MRRILPVVLVAWAGSLWTICGVVAPSLFAVIPERHLAGQVAGYFFRLETWLGLALGVVALLLSVRSAVRVARLDFGLFFVAMLAPLLSELVLRPAMDSAHAAGAMGRFGLLHGVSALLFALACLSTLILVWRSNAPAKTSAATPTM